MTVVSNGDPRSLAKTADIYVFISPNHGSGSMNNSKHNIQQNQQTEKEKKLKHTFTQKSVNLLSNLVARFRHKSLGISIFCCRRHRTFQTDPFKMSSGQLNVLLMHTLR